MCAVPYGKAVSGNSYSNRGGTVMMGGTADGKNITNAPNYLGVRADLCSKVTDNSVVDKAISGNSLSPNGDTTYEIRNVSTTLICPGSDVSKLRDYPWKKTERTLRILSPVSSAASGGWNYATGRPWVFPVETSNDTISAETLPTRAAPGNSQTMQTGKLSTTTAYPAKTT